MIPPERVERVVFLGTPEESVVALRALVDAGFDVSSVITQPDRRRGRGSKLDPSPVKKAAVELGLPLAHDLSGLTDSEADLGVVVAYGRIIPASILDELAMVNIHFSLLPRWRGAAPVERAILAGDQRTGVCLMEVGEGLDEGGVYAEVPVEIEADESAADLRARLAVLGADLLVSHLRDGLGPARPQEGEVTYAAKLQRDDFRLDFTRPAEEVARTVRIGRAWTTFRDRRIGVEAAVPVEWTGEPGEPGELRGDLVLTPRGALKLLAVKPEGKRTMSAEQWVNGARPGAGDHLG